MKSFFELNLPAPITTALRDLRFETPTPIQAAAIPLALEGKDLIGVAQTGTGKTAAFCIPILTHLLSSPGKCGLILAPTRELAAQIDELWKGLTRHAPQNRSVVLIGGVAMSPQVKALRANPRLLIATPGRLVDHLQQGTVRLSNVAFLVLDEADRMLDMGFAPQLSRIMKHVPAQRQTLLFSATWAPEVDRLSTKYLSRPEKVAVGSISRAAPKITQSAISVAQQGKNNLLLDELNAREGSILVFARTQSRTDRVAKYLNSYGIAANRIHGGRSQAQRTSALAAFKSGESRVLIATDIAARGIDVSDIAHVINFDLPQVPEDYIHRIGRTARAGTSGEALSFVSQEERKLWRDIVLLLKKSGSSVPEMRAGPALEAKEESNQARTSERRVTIDLSKRGPQPPRRREARRGTRKESGGGGSAPASRFGEKRGERRGFGAPKREGGARRERF